MTTRHCGKHMRRNKKWRGNAGIYRKLLCSLAKCEKEASTFSLQGIRFIPQTPRPCLGNLDHCARVNPPLISSPGQRDVGASGVHCTVVDGMRCRNCPRRLLSQPEKHQKSNGRGVTTRVYSDNIVGFAGHS